MNEPRYDPKSDRTLTEWFESPDTPTKEEAVAEAIEALGLDGPPDRSTPEGQEKWLEIGHYCTKRRGIRYRDGMSKQEVAVRLNNAAKATTKQKYLPAEVQERTGLEMNPLWMLETLVRSGTLTPKEQIVALKELARYTHSAAPSISHSTNTQMTPEDWLKNLAEEEFKEIDAPEDRAFSRAAPGQGRRYGSTQRRKERNLAEFEDYQQRELKAMANQVVDVEWTEVEFNGSTATAS